MLVLEMVGVGVEVIWNVSFGNDLGVGRRVEMLVFEGIDGVGWGEGM